MYVPTLHVISEVNCETGIVDEEREERVPETWTTQVVDLVDRGSIEIRNRFIVDESFRKGPLE